MATTRTLRFTAGTTTTITGAFNVHGSWSTPMNIASTTTSPATITANIGTINCNYITPSNTTVTGGSTWNAINSTDGGGNTGWNFSNVAAVQVYIGSLSTWKTVNKVQIQIGGVWKTVSKIQVSVSGSWKQIS